MRECGRDLHVHHVWVGWAQAHGRGEALDRYLRLAQIVLYPTAEKPRPGQVGLSPSARSVLCLARIKITDNEGERNASRAKSESIISAKFAGATREPLPLRSSPSRDRRPSRWSCAVP